MSEAIRPFLPLVIFPGGIACMACYVVACIKSKRGTFKA